MGIGKSKNKIDVIDSDGRLSRAHFYLHYPIGVNQFGVVWKAEHRLTREIYALKQLKKSEIIKQRHLTSVLQEQEILSRIRHSFISNIGYSFQDSEYFYLAIELARGADLGYHLRRKKFKENQAKFIIASIIISLEYLHNNSLIHRNLKPSNILLDEKGYVKLSDFLLAREWKEK